MLITMGHFDHLSHKTTIKTSLVKAALHIVVGNMYVWNVVRALAYIAATCTHTYE